MEQLLNTQTVPLCRTVLRREEECLIGGDFVLPEYCPDIAVVLKCQVTPRILGRQWSGNRLTVDGMAEVRVLYLDEERRCLRQAEFTQPLTCAVEGGGPEDKAYTRLDMTVKYANCRAVSPRRLEVRGAVSLQVTVEDSCPVETAQPPQEGVLFTRCRTVEATAMGAAAEKILAVSETVDFPSEHPRADVLLGGDCRAAVKECKLLAGKAIVKGEVYFHQLYTDDAVDGGVYAMDFALPFSQILDIDGAMEGVPYSVDARVLSDTQRCSEGPEGQGSVLEATAKLSIQLQLYVPQELPIILDAYHGRYPATVETAPLPVWGRLGCRFENETVPMSLELPPQPLDSLVDVWVQPLPAVCVCEDGTATVQGRLLVSMVVRDADGMLSYFERPEDYRLEYPCVGNAMTAGVTVADWRYRTAGGRLELQTTLALCLEQSDEHTLQAVTQVSLDKENPYPTERATLKLYYGEPGETLWDIGRQCHSSPDTIALENDLTGEVLSHATVLLVPTAE